MPSIAVWFDVGQWCGQDSENQGSNSEKRKVRVSGWKWMEMGDAYERIVGYRRIPCSSEHTA